jgi:toxin YoeB
MMVLPQEAYDPLAETAYLMRSPANLKMLQESLKDIEEGITIPFEFLMEYKIFRISRTYLRMKIEFSPIAFKDYEKWKTKKPLIAQKINLLLKDILFTPSEGRGNPEPLALELSGCWARRINREHRLIYKIKDDTVYVLACRYHNWSLLNLRKFKIIRSFSLINKAFRLFLYLPIFF